MSIRHIYSQTVADGTATSVVRPSDWNSVHNMVLNIGGNTTGTSQISGSDIVWAGGNNVTLSANGSTVTIIGPNTAAQTVQTQASGNIVGAGFTSASTAGSDIVATQNSNGLSIGVPAFLTTAQAPGAYLTTAAQSDHSHNFATTTTNGSLAVVATTNSAGATLAIPSWITTYAAQTNQTQASGNIAGVGTTFAGTNVSGSMTLNSAGLNLALIAAAGGGGGGSDGVNIVQLGTTGTTGTSYSASTGTVFFNGSNNITVSQNASNQMVIVGPDLTQYLTTAQPPGAYLTTAAQSNHSHNLATTTTNGSLAVVATTNSAGATIAFPSWLTTAGATNAITTAAQSNHSHNFATTTTGGSNMIVGITNSAGATVGVPAWITTYANDLTSGRAGTGTTFAGTNASASMTMNTNGLNFALSVAGGGVINQTGPNIAVAGQTVTAGTVYFSNSPTVTFGMDGASNITASAAGGGGGGGATLGKWEPFAPANTTTSTPGQNSVYMQRLQPEQNVSFNYVERRMSNSFASSTAARTAGYTFDYGLYSKGAGASSTRMELMGSSQMAMNVTMNSVSVTIDVIQGGATFSSSSAATNIASLVSGFKHFYMPFTNTLSAGQEYWFAQRMSSSGSSAALRVGLWEQTAINNLTIGKIYGSTLLASNSTYVGDFNQGVLATTSSALPATAHWSQLTNAVSQARMYMQFDDGV